jgi:hypothetical protein
MAPVRFAQIGVAALALVGCAFLVANVRTSESAWRLVNPTHEQGGTIAIPEKEPARDASGAAGWSWLEGTPGWKPAERIDGYPVAGLGPREIVKAKRSALRAGVEGSQVRVLASLRATTLIAILAAPLAHDRAQTCLAPMLHKNAPVQWLCPGEGTAGRRLSDASILVAAASFDWPGTPGTSKHVHPLYLVGVARGDVRRVVIQSSGESPETIYQRGQTWGQFDTARTVIDGSASLSVYGSAGLLETIRLSVSPGKTGIFR